jgi:MoxR-like ATPase
VNPEAVKAELQGVLDAVHQRVVGKNEALRTLLVGLLADGHVLLEDLPGLGKTLIAKSFASALGLSFHRIQFTADLLPTDITGGEVYDPPTGKFSFRPGPVFTHVLLADEINRAPPKVQSALLESMQEYQVTAGGTTYPLDRPFLVLATQNPIELEGTYALPEAQVDRFLLRLALGYPSPAEERLILSRRREARTDLPPLPQALGGERFRELQRLVEEVNLDGVLEGYIVDLVGATRMDARVEVGASPRGSLALAKCARAHALLEGRDYVVPDDIKALAVPALGHRLVIKPEPWIRGLRGPAVVSDSLSRVPVPKVV